MTAFDGAFGHSLGVVQRFGGLLWQDPNVWILESSWFQLSHIF